MPSVSPAQHRLMEAVAHDPGFAAKAGIPTHVGKEFVGKDAVKIHAAGTLFVDPEGRILLVKRSDAGDHGGEWGLPGGKIEGDETPAQAAKREALEELGTPYYPDDGRFFSRTQSSEGVDFTTFVCPVEARFVPDLNDEHTGHMWASLDDLPGKLHPGVRASLSPLAPAEDMAPDDWRGLVRGFLKFISEEEDEPEHAEDAMAFDLASSRTYTVEGHLHVARSPISKANVCEYRGREIPLPYYVNGVPQVFANGDPIPLIDDKKYRLLRSPEALKLAAASSNGKPLLITHESSEAGDHPKELTVGSLGTDAVFEDPYLYNSLSVWDGDAIRGIEDKSRRQLSAGYRYRLELTPGVFKGAPFDGSMESIIFNHEALVPAGRAGADVLVGDENTEAETQTNGEVVMKHVLSRKGLYLAAGVSALMSSRIAQDAVLDAGALFDGVTAKNFGDRKPKIVSALKSVKLAKDADIAPVLLALDAMEKEDVPEGADADPSSGLPMNAAEMKKKAEDEVEEEAKKKAEDAKAAMDKKAKDKRAKDRKARDSFVDNFKKGKDEKTCAAIDALMGELDGMDASERAEENEEGEEGGGGKDERGVDRKAMDAALIENGEAIRRELRQAAEAREFVEPFVGKVSLAMDSAADIYRLALDGLKVDLSDLPKEASPATLKAILKAQPKPGDGMKALALDEAPVDGGATSSRFSSIDRIAAA